ncbi:MAG: secA [Ignavibacteria bacterium]|nr:secA [Ignavibacteria bacterium]
MNFLTKLFGSKHDKDNKRMIPIVAEINSCFEEFNSLTDEEIRAKTDEFRQIIKDRTAELDEQRDKLQERLINEALGAETTADINNEIRNLDTEIYQIIRDTLDEILPQAYACVKQACQRLTDSRHHYEYAGQSAIWAMVPYDVQLMGAIVLHEGKIAEMATGEGKTLVAIITMYLNSLPGRGVHLVTVNDYLARRDCEWMKPVYDFLGITVYSIQSNMEPEERRDIYNMDITYGTNNEFGFDYLRDNMVTDTEHLVQRGHFYAIVDEVDSVLIDEARTPLIISGPVGLMDQKFEEMNPRVKRLVEAQTKLINQFTSEAEQLFKSTGKEEINQGGVNLLRAHRGLPKHKKLAKLMQDPENQKLLRETELFYLREQGRKMHGFILYN